jgi:alkylhydroperoxidase family enzyme
MTAHGAVLRKNFFTAEELTAIVDDFRRAGLPEEEVAVMAFAQKVVRAAHTISLEDIENLRSFGLGDEEIFDVILAASARCFFGHTLDAAGISPDEAYLEDLDGDLHTVLAVGRVWDPSTDEASE